MNLDAYIAISVLETFSKTLSVRYHHISVAMVVFVVGGVVNVDVVDAGIILACVLPYLSLLLILSLLRVYVGYVHLSKASFICCSSLCSK